MKKAYIFPGQGAQFTGMGKSLYDNNTIARQLFEEANDLLGFAISKIMFEGSAEELKQTQVTQPAVFIHSVAAFMAHSDFKPDMTAGHSLGEFSALTAAGVLSFADGLQLVAKRATAMQVACDREPSTMAAILGLEDHVVEEICKNIKNEIVVAANYNCPGQLVISGSIKGVEKACEALKAVGAKRALMLQVGGAFHSPLMQPASEDLKSAIEQTIFQIPQCPIYQNIDAKAYTNPELIKANLIAQLTAPVRWTQIIQNMIIDGADTFTECGPGNVLQGLVKKIHREVNTQGVQ